LFLSCIQCTNVKKDEDEDDQFLQDDTTARGTCWRRRRRELAVSSGESQRELHMIRHARTTQMSHGQIIACSSPAASPPPKTKISKNHVKQVLSRFNASFEQDLSRNLRGLHFLYFYSTTDPFKQDLSKIYAGFKQASTKF